MFFLLLYLVELSAGKLLFSHVPSFFFVENAIKINLFVLRRMVFQS